jgi:hypothetical protein
MYSIRQHTSAYVSIRQHTSAYVSSTRQHTSEGKTQHHHLRLRYCIRQHTSIYQHTSAYVSIRYLSSVLILLHAAIYQHTSAYVSIRQHTSAYMNTVCCYISIAASYQYMLPYITLMHVQYIYTLVASGLIPW